MIEKSLQTTSGRLQVRMPTILNEITLGQIMELQEKQNFDDLKAISILSGLSMENLHAVADIQEFKIFNDHIQSLAQQIKYLFNSDIIPHKVTFVLGKRKVSVNVIRNLSIEPADAFLIAKDIIADEINRHINLYGEDKWQVHFQPHLNACCQVLAQYFFCRATGKTYNEVDAEAFCEEVKKLRVTEALPIARHFFTSYPDLLHQNIGFFDRLRQYWRRRQVYRRLKYQQNGD